MKNIIINFCLLILAGCSGQSNTDAASSVLAKVNGDEVYAYALHSELQASQQNADDPSVVKNVLTGLIDRQLLVQEALKLDLERAPEVIQAIESAKAKIYAQAYLAKKIAKLPSATESDINQFIESHPDKFKHRKVFKMQDVVFSNEQSLVDLQRVEKEVLTLGDLQAILSAKGIHFETGSSQFFTDRLPEHVLNKIKSMKKGDLLFLHSNHNIIVKSIDDIIEQPMPDKSAHLLAARLLSQQQQQEFVTQEIARLKALANIQVLDSELNGQPQAANH
ncbi:EpsD family peptidyl-prolyl cis-trans isomerase [Methylophilus sp. 5]|uniref:EpsD family peptidyl-prolyl cis-trans isomerase n=1 Tax=Methylophilus sp. 5 TaxID=1112274 RepID=UPI0009DD20CF|nr:EpsD family peptidyl-prolyl cis-trans isomerase [Methylophilus sp. 5]